MKLKLKGEWISRRVWLNGKPLSPTKSQKVWNHSPDGFNWGYGGSGPAQLALAICLEMAEGKKEAKMIDYQEFKRNHIATLPQSDFEVEIDFPETAMV